MKTYALFFGLLVALCSSCSTSSRTAALKGGADCCSTDAPKAAVAVTDKSIYQLDSSWTTDAGQPVKLAALHGKVQVVAMFFASCTYACPLIVQDMKQIEGKLPPNVRGKVGFTLITIDPERDTPTALHEYRATRKLAMDRWTLLRGNADDTLEFAALLGVKFKREITGQFAHSNLITVLNAEGEIIHQVVGLNQDLSATIGRIVVEASKPITAHE